jgi:dynein heavy chain
LSTKSEAIAATVKIVGECNKLMKQHLFNVYFSKSQRLEDFEQSQKQAIAGAVNTIKEGWVNAIKSAILSSFKHVGKGWFNLHETSHEIHDYSKLKRFLNMTRFRMEDTLRFLVEESITSFGGFMHSTCSPKLAVKATNDVSVVGAAASEDGGVPLFALELVMTDKGFDYNTKLEKFESTVVKIFESAVTSLHNIPQLEPAIMVGACTSCESS